MLVLSRKKDEKVVFPNLGISVSVVSVDGRRVRLGFTAPEDVAILRGELAHEKSSATARPGSIDRHQIRNRLNSVVLSLHLLSQNMLGDPVEADGAIAKALWELSELDRELDGLAPANTTSSDGRQQKTTRRGEHRALIVEDNDNERQLLAAYLRMRGYEVDEAEDGLQALQFLKDVKPDVVLLDMNMPRLNGAKTVSQIRHTPELKCVKVFGVSGTDRDDWKMPLGDSGVDAWFRKPINPESIVKQLDQLVAV